jgi:hypothetical protein
MFAALPASGHDLCALVSLRNHKRKWFNVAAGAAFRMDGLKGRTRRCPDALPPLDMFSCALANILF